MFCSDGPKLPSSAPQAVQRILERIKGEACGLYALNDEKKVASVITHELLLVAQDAAFACECPKRAQLRLLAKLVAAAVGGTVAADDNLLLTVGKRLDRQAGKVRDALAHLNDDYVIQVSRLQHEAHRDPSSLCAALPTAIDKLWASSNEAVERQETEIYVGFQELELEPAPAFTPAAQAPCPAHELRSSEAPTVAMREGPGTLAGVKGDWLFMPKMSSEWEEGYTAGREQVESEKQWVEKRVRGEMRIAAAHHALELQFEHQKLLWARGANEGLKEDLAHKEKRHNETIERCGEYEDEIEDLRAKLAESRAREEALHRVIRDNCMHS